MFENRAYWLKAVPVLILGVFLMYFHSGLQNDHVQILYMYFEKLGWSARDTTNPVTISGFVVVLMYFTIGTLLLKFGIVRILVPSIIILGLYRYQAANRWIMAIQGIPMALSLYFMSYILDTTGSLDLAYKIMLWLVGVAIVCLIFVGRKPDYDRSHSSASCGNFISLIKLGTKIGLAFQGI